MRLNFEAAMGELASEEIQEEIWPNPPPFTGFDLVIHILFDDVNIRENPDWNKDYGLKPEQADCVFEVMSTIEALWERCGIEADQAVLRSQPEWEKVVKLAKRYINLSEVSDDYREYCMSRRSYFERFESGIPFEER
ncbi:MAG: hypothetical protein JST12_07430 [Armatimonadetes bacterium]|nr:hypothetical protein [Armatimonadota bacterium]